MNTKQTIDSARTNINEKKVEYEDIAEHLHGDAEFSGPTSNRKCTNLSSLIFFISLNIMLVAITIYILIKGDPQQLSKGYDFRGNTCGVGNLENKKFMFYPNSTNLDWSLCIESCPYYYFANYYCLYSSENPNKYYTEWGCHDAYETTSYGFFCIPAHKGREKVFLLLGEAMQIIQKASGDLYQSWDVLLISYIISMLIGLLYLFLLRIAQISKLLILGTIYTLITLALCLIFLFYSTGKKALEQSCGQYGPVNPGFCETSTYKFYLSLSIFTGLLLFIYLYEIIKKYESFNIGVQMISLTSKPLRVMKELAIFPIVQIFIGSWIMLLLALLIGWNMSIYSKVEINSIYVPGEKSFVLKYTSLEKWMLAYNAFMSLWWCFFLVDLGKFVMSGGVSTWYFSRQKSVLYGPIFSSVKYALKYHLGSIALGSIGKIFSLILKFLFLPKLAQYLKPTPNNPGTFYKICLLKMCFCIQLHNKFIRYITKHNYTVQAIFANPYFPSGKIAFHLMKRNHIRIGRPAKIGTFIINMIKQVIILSGLCTTLILIIFPKTTLSGKLTIELTGFSGPILFSFILSWFIGEVFGGALEVSLNTVLLSAACDEEMFAREQRFIEKDLLEFMDGIGEEQNFYHQENKNKIVRNGGSEDMTGLTYMQDDKFMFKVIPDRSWGKSGRMERMVGDDRVKEQKYEMKEGDKSDYERNEDDDVVEKSLDEPQVVYGYAAQYVD